jgi:hypothetical protein
MIGRAVYTLPNGLQIEGTSAAIDCVRLLIDGEHAPASTERTARLMTRIEAAGFEFDGLGHITGKLSNFRALLSSVEGEKS